MWKLLLNIDLEAILLFACVLQKICTVKLLMLCLVFRKYDWEGNAVWEFKNFKCLSQFQFILKQEEISTILKIFINYSWRILDYGIDLIKWLVHNWARRCFVIFNVNRYVVLGWWNMSLCIHVFVIWSLFLSLFYVVLWWGWIIVMDLKPLENFSVFNSMSSA